MQVVPVATPGPVGGIGHREPRLNAVRAQRKFEGHQHAPKEGPLSKDSRFRSEVERHRLNEKGTSEVAVDYRPRSRTMMEGHSPMRGNGAADAPRISNTPGMGRMGGGRVPGPPGCGLRPQSCTGRATGHDGTIGGRGSRCTRTGQQTRPGFQTLLVWDANGRWAHSWAARLRLAPGIVHRPQMRKSPALRTDGAGPRGLRHARHCVGGFVPAACTKGSLGGCAEASDSTRQSPSFHEIRGFKFFEMEILEKRGGSGPPLLYTVVYTEFSVLQEDPRF